MIHAPDDTDSIIARLASRREFFNSLSQEQTWHTLARPGSPRYARLSRPMDII